MQNRKNFAVFFDTDNHVVHIRNGYSKYLPDSPFLRFVITGVLESKKWKLECKKDTLISEEQGEALTRNGAIWNAITNIFRNPNLRGLPTKMLSTEETSAKAQKYFQTTMIKTLQGYLKIDERFRNKASYEAPSMNDDRAQIKKVYAETLETKTEGSNVQSVNTWIGLFVQFINSLIKERYEAGMYPRLQDLSTLCIPQARLGHLLWHERKRIIQSKTGKGKKSEPVTEISYKVPSRISLQAAAPKALKGIYDEWEDITRNRVVSLIADYEKHRGNRFFWLPEVPKEKKSPSEEVLQEKETKDSAIPNFAVWWSELHCHSQRLINLTMKIGLNNSRQMSTYRDLLVKGNPEQTRKNSDTFQPFFWNLVEESQIEGESIYKFCYYDITKVFTPDVCKEFLAKDSPEFLGKDPLYVYNKLGMKRSAIYLQTANNMQEGVYTRDEAVVAVAKLVTEASSYFGGRSDPGPSPVQ